MGCDYADVRQVVEQVDYVVDIKRKRERNEPALNPCPAPSETQSPAPRWKAERALARLAKRDRSTR
jgi:hypothetical protein